METEETAEATGGESPPRGQGGRPMPLNSRRVTGPILRSVAATLGRASAEELRHMIDGRLEELGREPRDVLVVVGRGTVETDEPGHVWLHDGEGPVRLQKRNQRISETTRLQSSARAVINRRAPKSYRSARATILAHALATLRALVLLAHALSGATPILVYASLCVTKRLRREYTSGNAPAFMGKRIEPDS